MAQKAQLQADDLAVISWHHPDGSLATSAPLPRAHAEALARAYAEFFKPSQTYGIQPVAWLEAPKRRPGSRHRTARRDA
jgi:hypothetical protein